MSLLLMCVDLSCFNTSLTERVIPVSTIYKLQPDAKIPLMVRKDSSVGVIFSELTSQLLLKPQLDNTSFYTSIASILGGKLSDCN